MFCRRISLFRRQKEDCLPPSFHGLLANSEVQHHPGQDFATKAKGTKFDEVLWQTVSKGLAELRRNRSNCWSIRYLKARERESAEGSTEIEAKCPLKSSAEKPVRFCVNSGTIPRLLSSLQIFYISWRTKSRASTFHFRDGRVRNLGLRIFFSFKIFFIIYFLFHFLSRESETRASKTNLIDSIQFNKLIVTRACH